MYVIELSMVYLIFFLLRKKLFATKSLRHKVKNFVFFGSQNYFRREDGVWFCCAKHCTLQTLKRSLILNELLQPLNNFQQPSTLNLQLSTFSLLLRNFLFHFYFLSRCLCTLCPCLLCLALYLCYPLIIQLAFI